MQFTDSDQEEHRAAFIRECQQKAWGAACEADYISEQADKLMTEYAKLKEESDALAASPDHHTVAGRERRKRLAAGMKLIEEGVAKGQERMRSLLATADQNLAIGKHAERWGWKEIDSALKSVTPSPQ